MMPRRFVLAACATALLVALAGCAGQSGPSPYAAATAASLQQTVLHVTESAGEGDFAAARARLDELEVDTKVAFARGELTAARRDSILAAIALVRADLEAQLAAAEAEAEAERQKAEDEARKAAEAKAAEEARQAAEAEAAAEAERQAAEQEAAERDAETSGNSGSGESDDDDDNSGSGNGNGKDKGEGKSKGKGKD